MCVSKRICPDEKRVVGRLRVYLTYFGNLIKFIVQWRPMYIFVYVKKQYMRLKQTFVTDKGSRFEPSQFVGSRMDFVK